MTGGIYHVFTCTYISLLDKIANTCVDVVTSTLTCDIPYFIPLKDRIFLNFCSIRYRDNPDVDPSTEEGNPPRLVVLG